LINYYVIDLETTGLSLAYQEICECSIIRAEDRMQLTRQVIVDKPENSSFDALKIIGKSMADLRKGITKEQLIKEAEILFNEDKDEPSNRCIVGHNIISFDKRWLWALWERFGKRFPAELYLDTIHLFKAYGKKKGLGKIKHNLTDACNMIGIKKVAGIHNARSDTRNTYLLWQELIKEVDFLDHIKRLPHILEGDIENDNDGRE
jgi:DNA polymerase III epsilon subunit-like protein